VGSVADCAYEAFTVIWADIAEAGYEEAFFGISTVGIITYCVELIAVCAGIADAGEVAEDTAVFTTGVVAY